MGRARRIAVLGGAAILLLIPFQSGLTPFGWSPPVPAAESREKTERLATLVNDARVAAGRPPLARSAELDEAAERHSRDMANNDFLEHEGSDGSTPQERATRVGYHVPPGRGWLVVEVISAVSDDPGGPLNWWMNESPLTHGRHLLDSRYRETGLGYASGGTYGNYWTVLVGCRPGVLPIVEHAGVAYAHQEQCDDQPPDPSELPLAGSGDQ